METCTFIYLKSITLCHYSQGECNPGRFLRWTPGLQHRAQKLFTLADRSLAHHQYSGSRNQINQLTGWEVGLVYFWSPSLRKWEWNDINNWTTITGIKMRRWCQWWTEAKIFRWRVSIYVRVSQQSNSSCGTMNNWRLHTQPISTAETNSWPLTSSTYMYSGWTYRCV